MALAVPQLQTKRIKLEHSYAYDDESVPVKFEFEKGVEIVKIETHNSTTDLEVDRLHEIHSFDCLSMSSDGGSCTVEPTLGKISTTSEKDTNTSSVPFVNNTAPQILYFECDPLEVENYECVATTANNVLSEIEKNKPEGNSHVEARYAESESLFELNKERNNLRKQIEQLRALLKLYELKEKALRRDLQAREMTKWALQEQNLEIQLQIEAVKIQEKRRTEVIDKLNQQLHHVKVNSFLKNSKRIEMLRKKHAKELEECSIELRETNMKLRQKQSAYTKLIESVDDLTSVSTNQEKELEETNQKILETESNLEDITKVYETLQKSLHTEKKTIRDYIREQDQLHQKREEEYKEVSNMLELRKTSMWALNLALKKIIAENNAMQEAMKKAEEVHQKLVKELQCEIDEARQNVEFHRICQYCGL